MSDPFFDESRKKKTVQHEIGEELSALSLDELDARIALLKNEIHRLEDEKTKKSGLKSAADHFFKPR